jgi:hypothetical protein
MNQSRRHLVPPVLDPNSLWQIAPHARNPNSAHDSGVPLMTDDLVRLSRCLAAPLHPRNTKIQRHAFSLPLSCTCTLCALYMPLHIHVSAFKNWGSNCKLSGTAHGQSCCCDAPTPVIKRFQNEEQNVHIFKQDFASVYKEGFQLHGLIR